MCLVPKTLRLSLKSQIIFLCDVIFPFLASEPLKICLIVFYSQNPCDFHHLLDSSSINKMPLLWDFESWQYR